MRKSKIYLARKTLGALTPIQVTDIILEKFMGTG